jgi:MFS superfamily sulfate permease-like transporter
MRRLAGWLIFQMERPEPLIMPLGLFGWVLVGAATGVWLCGMGAIVTSITAVNPRWMQSALGIFMTVLYCTIALLFLALTTPYPLPLNRVREKSNEAFVFCMLRPAILAGVALPYLTYWYMGRRRQN